MSHSTSNYTAANKLMIGVLYVLPYVYNICLPPSSNVSLVLGYDLCSTLRVLNVYCTSQLSLTVHCKAVFFSLDSWAWMSFNQLESFDCQAFP